MAVKDRRLEDEIHARLRQLTTEVRALREDLEGTLKKPQKRATRALLPRPPAAAGDMAQQRKKQKRST